MAPSQSAARLLSGALASAGPLARGSGFSASGSRLAASCRAYTQKRAARELSTLRERGEDGRRADAPPPAQPRPPSKGGRRLPVAKGRVSAALEVPEWIRRPPYSGSSELPEQGRDVQVHDGEALRKVRRACALAARVLAEAGGKVAPGVTTEEIDRTVHEAIISAGAYPSPLGYGGFPKSVCTSVNEVVCHGIPDDRELRDGDIVNVDVTVYLDGYHGDTSATFYVGEPSEAARELVETTREALDKAIEACGPGVPYRAIGRAIGDVAHPRGFGLVDAFAGHGLGALFHSAPTIYHCPNRLPGNMRLGETFTIEPMLTARSPDVRIWKDGWTAVTRDGGLSAQFEHALVVTQDGCEVLTRPDADARDERELEDGSGIRIS